MWGRLARLMDALRSCQSGCQYLPAYPPPGSSTSRAIGGGGQSSSSGGFRPNMRPVELVQHFPAGLLSTEQLLPG